jgi:hypothetical protein
MPPDRRVIDAARSSAVGRLPRLLAVLEFLDLKSELVAGQVDHFLGDGDFASIGVDDSGTVQKFLVELSIAALAFV